MKILKKWIPLFLGIFLICYVLGGIIPSGIESFQQYEKDQEILYVSFSKEEEESEPFDYRQIDDYVSEFSDYNSHVVYETLSSDEKRIYRFFEYALDHGYTSVFIDSRLIEKAEASLVDILNFLAMDSPFVQQNFEYTTVETGFIFSYLYDFLSFEIQGVRINTQLFSESDLEKKKEALEAAKEVVQNLPADLSDLEKARYFYRYLTGQVKYRLYEEEEKAHYLYDALVKKETQCDGYANAFSILCALENIPCVEKIYYPENKEEIGHTWNLFSADGVWYNADCAIKEDFALEQKEMGIDFYFGFSNEREENASYFNSRLPQCNTDLYPISLVLPSPSDPGMRSRIGQAFRESESDCILICLESGEFSENDFQQIANFLQSDFRSVSMDWQGKKHYYFLKTE